MISLCRISAILLFASALQAAEMPPVDDALPQPLDADVFANDLLTHSPFTRIVNLEEMLQLTGIAYVDGRPVATFLNKTTKQHVTVSEEPNAQGWRITSTTPGEDLHDTEVQLMIGSEVITMHYGDAQLTPGGSRKGEPGVFGARSSSSGMRLDSKDGNRPKTSSFLGANGRELYSSLSSEGRDKLKDSVHSYLDKHPDRTPEQISTYAQKIFSKIKADDQRASSAKTPKTSSKPAKPSKNR
jgi:hypothetical protein